MFHVIVDEQQNSIDDNVRQDDDANIINRRQRN